MFGVAKQPGIFPHLLQVFAGCSTLVPVVLGTTFVVSTSSLKPRGSAEKCSCFSGFSGFGFAFLVIFFNYFGLTNRPLGGLCVVFF